MDLGSLFSPSSVAIVGASRDPKKFGNVVLNNFMLTFKGKIYPVNPKVDEIMGLKCYPRVSSIKDKVDLAVIIVPSDVAIETVEDCGKKGVKSLVIITSGFSEVGDREKENRLGEVIKKYKMRAVGPNCLGILDTYSGVDTIFNPQYKLNRPSKGPISFVSQSGALGAAVLDWAHSEFVGMSKFVSYGNGIDLRESELIDYLGSDETTRAIALYLEGLEDGHKFIETCMRVSKKKPIIALKAGKSEAGSKAAMSHTGSLAGSANVFSGVFKQCGAIEVGDVDELFDLSRILAYQKPLAGNRIAVVTNGGGFGVLAADAIEECGMKLATFSPAAEKLLRDSMPPHVNVRNPMDLVGDADTKRYKDALDIIAKEDGVDCILVILLMQVSTLGSDVIDSITEVYKNKKKPVVACSAGGNFTQLHMHALEKEGIPAYPTPRKAVKAIKALWEYGKIKNKNKKIE
ncbi:MAG: CoA-binding protein [Candidatus Aenigmarchaeota archaeon]|nr:CoA-binding protein [Candidatus Aenigmarchaeota archaeon]